MSKHNPTIQQQQAIAADRHIVVTANAGSGKTSVLIERYLQILLNNKSDEKQYDPRKIVAITFTEQAAREMLNRIIKKIEEKINCNDETHDYKLIRRNLSQANISTIHSFCTKILREYPVDAHLSPNFTILSEYQSYNIKKNAINEAINEYLEDIEVDEEIRSLIFTNYSHREITNYIERLFYKIDIFDEINKIYSNQKEFLDIIKHEASLYFENTILDFKKYLESCEPILNDLKIKDKNSLEVFKNLTQKLLLFKTEDYTLNDLNTIIKTISSICELKDGNLYLLPKILKKHDEGLIYSLNNKEFNATQYRNKIAEQVKINLDTENILQQFYLSKEIVKIANIAKNLINEAKNKIDAIDFDDMLLRTRDLLKNPEIAKSVASNYTHILVDEFQDTNSIQYEIISSLVPLQDSQQKNLPNLFIVGDDKQSIYRFRNADVAIFNKAREDVKNYNKHNLTNIQKKSFLLPNNSKLEIFDENTSLGDLELTATFRLFPVVAAFVDKVCEANFKNFNNSEIKYKPLVCGKNSGEFINYFQIKETDNLEIQTRNIELGSVKILLTVEPYKDKNQEQEDVESNDEYAQEEQNENLDEAKRLATYIKYLIDSGAAKAHEIGILYRSRTKISLLQTEFIKLKIPYSVISGGGFFGQQEIHDLINFLKFLYNSGDDLALLGVLRSPFFNINDELLYYIVTRKGNSLFEKLNICENFSEEIKFAIDNLKKASNIANIVSLPHLLRFILKSENWYCWLKTQKEAEKIKQNVEKFISLARDFESREFTSIGDFIKELETLQEISKEAEAVLDPAENAVSFLTIHASKGMEFPVVALYALNSKVKSSTAPFLSKKFGLSFNTFDVNTTLGAKKSPNIITLLSKSKEQQAENEELARLLYVATTRAEKQLILSATVKQNKSGEISNLSPYFGFFVDGLSEDINNIVKKIGDENENYISTNLQINLLGAKKTFNYSAKIEINPEINLIEQENKKENEEIKIPKIMIDEKISCIEKNRTFSFSLIKSFLNFEKEENYYSDDYLKRAIGFQNLELNLNNNINNYDNSNQITINASEKGLIYHKIFENISVWFGNKSVNEIKLFETINTAISKQNIRLEKKYIDEIFEKCKIISQTKLFENYSQNIANAKREYELTMPIGDNFITGNIDFLVKNESNEWEIWDWKTNKIQDKSDLSRLKEEYELQMKIYSYFLMHLEPNQKKFVARLLLTELANIDSQDNDWTVKYEFILANKSEIKKELISYINQICTKIS